MEDALAEEAEDGADQEDESSAALEEAKLCVLFVLFFFFLLLFMQKLNCCDRSCTCGQCADSAQKKGGDKKRKAYVVSSDED